MLKPSNLANGSGIACVVIGFLMMLIPTVIHLYTVYNVKWVTFGLGFCLAIAGVLTLEATEKLVTANDEDDTDTDQRTDEEAVSR